MNSFLKIINTLMPLITIILNAVIAYIVSKYTARQQAQKTVAEKKELEKSKVDSLFLNLLSLTQRYCAHHIGGTKTECLETAVALMQIVPKNFIPLVKEMYSAVDMQNYDRITELRKDLLEFYLQSRENAD